MGENNYGQLGDGTSNQTNRPEQIVASNVTAIAAGNFHSLFLKSDGSLWAMGYNSSGELGDSTNNNTNQPEEIVGSNVTAIAAGARHSLFLKSDGSLWAMGSNQYGQLGDGAFPFPTNRPEQIVASNVTAIAAGQYHSLFLKSDGSLWSMGLNGSGQLGDGTYNNAIRPEPVVASNVIAIATGAEANCSLFVKSDGSLWGMGDNSFGRLGISANPSPGSTNRPTEIVGSNVVVFVVVSAGGQQVNGYTINEAWRLDGDAAVTAASAGGGQTLILMSNGSLGALGWDAYGQLGNGIYDQYGATARPQLILAAYNQISSQLLGGTNMQLNFVGIANANYALDWSSSLSPPNWIPQATNPASSFGPLVFTNPPDATTNNFWRIRSVP
jgi:hypothetical protein